LTDRVDNVQQLTELDSSKLLSTVAGV